VPFNRPLPVSKDAQEGRLTTLKVRLSPSASEACGGGSRLSRQAPAPHSGQGVALVRAGKRQGDRSESGIPANNSQSNQRTSAASRTRSIGMNFLSPQGE